MNNIKHLLAFAALLLFGYSCSAQEKDFPSWAIGGFERYENNPVISPNGGNSWDSENTYNPSVIKRDDKFYMLYRGEDSNKELFRYFRSQIGLATSDDGLNWKRYENNPVIKADQNYELPGGCEDPRLTELNGVYYAYYTAYNADAKDIQVQLCVATSTDLINWEKHGPIYRGNMKNAALVMDSKNNPVKINDKYMMYAGGSGRPHVAFSDDLINWDFKPLDLSALPKEFNPWEFCVGLAQYQSNGNILVFIGGRINGDIEPNNWHYALGQILFNEEKPDEMKDYLKEPFLYPTMDYEKKGFVNYTLFFETIMEHDGKWWIWYGGADKVTCVATAPK